MWKHRILEGQIDKHTDMTKLRSVFHNFANGPLVRSGSNT